MSSREAAQSQTDYCVSWWPATVPRGLRFKPGVSLVASIGGVALLPLYAQSLFQRPSSAARSRACRRWSISSSAIVEATVKIAVQEQLSCSDLTGKVAL